MALTGLTLSETRCYPVGTPQNQRTNYQYFTRLFRATPQILWL